MSHASWFLFSVDAVPQSWQFNSPCFCRIRRVLTHWLHTVAELMVSAIDNFKMMAGGHAVHEWQAIL